MDDVLAPLYPPEADDTPTVLRMPAPRLADPPPDIRNVGTVADHYGPNLLDEWVVADGDRVAVIDKAFPHSRYDLLLLASDDEVRSAVTDLAPATKGLLFGAVADFVDFLSDPEVVTAYDLSGGHFQASFNFDRDTVDRENSMFYDKRFHLHMNYTPGRDIALEAPVRWADIPGHRLRRRLIDPIAYLGASIIHDATGGTAGGLPLLSLDDARDLRLGLPPGAKLRIDGWGALRTPQFSTALDDLHRHAERAYRVLHVAFTGAPHAPRPWRRPSLLPADTIVANLDEIGWLSTGTRKGLTTLARVLKDVSDSDLTRFRADEGARVEHLTVAGLDYAMSVFSRGRNTAATPLAEHDEVYLVMQPKLFGDIGGAGLPTVDGVPIVRLDRSAGPTLTAAELADRRALRRHFLDRASAAMARRHGLAPVRRGELHPQHR